MAWLQAKSQAKPNQSVGWSWLWSGLDFLKANANARPWLQALFLKQLPPIIITLTVA